ERSSVSATRSNCSSTTPSKRRSHRKIDRFMQPRKQHILEPIEQRSAGGAGFRESGGQLQVVMILTAAEKRWQIPKGIIDPGETPEQAAIREVREESGVNAEIIEKIATTDYWFSFPIDGIRRRIHKYVDFYLMRYTGGDT